MEDDLIFINLRQHQLLSSKARQPRYTVPSSGQARLSVVDLQIVFAQPRELILNINLSGKI